MVSASNSKLALVEHLPSSASHTALDQKTQKDRMEEVLVAGPSAALDVAFVLCPAAISAQFDGVQGSVNLPAFLSSFKVN